ncbi:hypothetical protein OQA88_3852 [Cercophora sp. LCS_1]
MEGVSSLPSDLYKGDVDQTIRELNDTIKEVEDALRQLRGTTPQIPDSALTQSDSMEIMATAYRGLSESGPFLPSRGSVLPALLALRTVNKTTAETKAYMQSQAGTLEQTKKKIEAEEINLREQRALEGALQKRIKSLREGLEHQEKKTAEELDDEKIAKLREEKTRFDKQTSSLMKDLDWFIENHLGLMLAAEELGGPVVGEMTEIEPDDLTAGFSAQGKLKKAKGNPDEDRRQRRIDEIWGAEPEQAESRNKRKRDRDESSAAGTELRELIEQLLNTSMEAGGDSSAAYIRIERESAAARFLVRSKVAEFHPKDAKRLRLIDFGRELDD